VFDEIPMPAAVAARPRDVRGYPVPAITPWENGTPQFARTGVARTFLCAAQRRCSICSTEIAPGPVWRVIGGIEADMIVDVLGRGRPYRNAAPTAEAPGHRTCMLYAAMVCPYLARPNARRGTAARAPGIDLARGERRGTGGAVAGFRSYEFSFTEADGVLFRFDGLLEFLPHELGSDHLPALAAAVADGEDHPTSAQPPYLLTDEDAAVRAFQHCRQTTAG
jgi:hypothetical protein